MIRALALVLALVSPPAMAETWRIGTEADYAPYIYRDGNGELTGLDKELGDTICARAGVTCDWSEVSFDALLPGIASGQFDLVLAGIGETPARRDFAAFSIPYRHGGNNVGVFAGLAEGMVVESSLIAVQAGTVHEEWLLTSGYRVQSFPSQESALRALVARQVDLVFGSSSYMQHAFETDFPQLRLVATEEFPSAGASVAMDKSDTLLLDRINAILQGMKEDGTLEAIQDRWFVTGEPV